MKDSIEDPILDEEYVDNTNKLIIYGAATTIVVLGAAGYIFKDQIKNFVSSADIQAQKPKVTNLNAAVKDKPEYITVSDTTYVPINYTVKKGDNLWNIVTDQFPGLKTSNEIVIKIKEVVDTNKGGLAHLSKDNLSVMEGKVVDEPDGIPGDLIYPDDELNLGQEMVISQKKVPVKKDMTLGDTPGISFPDKVGFENERGLYSQNNLESLTQNHYDATITGYNANSLYDCGDLVSGMNSVADYYNRFGKNETLDTFAFLKDDPEVLRAVLNFQRSHGIKIKTNLNILSDIEVVQSALVYAVCPNINDAKIDLERITGMHMSTSTMYRLLDKAGEKIGFDGKIRKQGNPDLMDQLFKYFA